MIMGKPTTITTTEELRDITPAMRETWLFIARHVQKYGTTPTTDEVARQFDIGHTTAHQRIRGLAQRGIITRKPENKNKCRAYVLFVWPAPEMVERYG